MIGINPTRGFETSLENVLPRFLSCINHPFFYRFLPDNLSGVFHLSASFMHFFFFGCQEVLSHPSTRDGPDGICVFARNLMPGSEGSHVFRENRISQGETAARQILLTDCTAALPSFTSA